MTLTLLLPWFPILLAVGVGGRLLGRGRGFALGLVCAMFWIVLVQASAGTGVWRQPWVVVTMLIGAAAILLMGGWAGSAEGGPTLDPMLNRTQSPPQADDRSRPCADAWGSDSSESQRAGIDKTAIALDRFAAVIRQFDDWLVEHRDDNDPWPAFGEFIRGVLFQ
ncbi:MAG: hypothetical protein AAB363_06325, partial [Planctomycetota bacterium]